MTWLFYSASFSTAFQSYQHNGRMNTKTSVQYSSGLAWTDSCLQLDLDTRPNDLKPAEPCECFNSNSSILQKIVDKPIALRAAKTLWSFGCSECNRVKQPRFVVFQTAIV